MRSLPYSISAILGVLLAAIGIYVVTHKEPRLRIRRSFRIAAVLQVSLVMILLEISGILKLHHVADPIFFFSFLIIFVISCLLSHFVSSQVEKLYS